jgi:hypothetical protein
MTEFVFLVRNAPINIEAILKSRDNPIELGYHFVSGRQDSNLRPPGPKPGALPACATSRLPQKNVVFKGVAKIKINFFTKGFILFFIE